MVKSKNKFLLHMPSTKYERRSLLPNATQPNDDQPAQLVNVPISSEDENTDEDAFQIKKKKRRVKLSISGVRIGRGQRHQIHRGARRLAKYMICALMVPVVLLGFYINFYSSATLRRVALSEWGYNISRNVAEYVLPENETALLEPRNICRDKIFLLIIVCSGVDNFAARQNIRDTWGNTTEFNYHMFSQLHENFNGKYLDPSPRRLQYYRDYIMGNSSSSHQSNTTSAPSTIPVRIVFLIGRRKYESLLGNETLTRLHSESEHYDDIIQENFIDSYKNLTVKSVMALKWVTRRCLHATAFIMKCDDDTFVNVPNLLQHLLGGTVPLYNDTLDMHDQRSYQVLAEYNRLNATSNLLMGHLFCSVHPIADVTSKWYMPYYMYPADTYPTYLSGASYIMSSDVVPKLYAASLNTSLLYLEDIYITGICAERIKLRRHHNPLFSFKHSKSPCTMKGSLTQHYMKNDAMLDMYAFVSNVSIKCAPPGKYFRTVRLRKTNSCS